MLCPPYMVFREITARTDKANSKPIRRICCMSAKKVWSTVLPVTSSGSARHQILQIHQVGNHFCIVTYNIPISNHEY